MNAPRHRAPGAPPGRYLDGTLPANVRLGPGTTLRGTAAFHRFFAKHDGALVIGGDCEIDSAVFAVGASGVLSIGHHCRLNCPILLCEARLSIGNYVLIGWNATIADADFHPVAPAERLADAIAISGLGAGHDRQPFASRPVRIEDDVWIGPLAVILKGVTIGAGAFVEPGAVVTRDVPPRCRVLGNPAVIVGEV